MTSILRPMIMADADAVLQIYEEGIASGHATFQKLTPTWETWDKDHLPECRWVLAADSQTLGWAALSAVSSRCVYAGVAEVSVYVSASSQGKGFGSMLLARLVTSSEEAGIWTLQAGIFPENAASVRLHQRHGFRQLGLHEKLGKMTHGPLAGKWRDVVFMERRSTKVGI